MVRSVQKCLAQFIVDIAGLIVERVPDAPARATGAQVTYLRVPGAGHLVHDDAPEEYRDAVQRFLAVFAGRA